DPDTAFGDDLLAHLPRGAGEARWRRLLNEAQVLLHQHPLNAARTAKAQLPVNSLWLWGAGPVPDWVRTDVATVVSDDPLLVGLAKLANVTVAPPETVVLHDWQRPVLVDLRRRRDATALDAEWIAPTFEALRKRRFESVVLAYDGAPLRLCKRPNLWQIFRRPKGLW
ncbi:MAG TPA: phosphoglycerate mutase, partial [Xanthomonadales bacterium]|nr:phosphoglycerate mutase [Xanthomonadales bacterium]